MAAALQSSHRLLLIGDHFQLPPFNARMFRELLGDPLRVKLAIESGARFAPSLVDATVVEEADDREPFAARCARWSGMVSLFAVIFQESRGDDGSGPAATLTDQHRMHPDIADLVGRIFYPSPAEPDGTILNSPEETHEQFQGDLPDTHVWYDVPWVQKTFFAEGEIDGLFCSPKEVRAVVDVLAQIVPREGQDCSIQILSPYNDQLERIRAEIESQHRSGRLGDMFRPPFDLRMSTRMGATVDEFQGSEADIVIVSLVRNNALVPWKSVGFLKEPNRMNVLLSRARHKLVIVGSWEFFAKRCDEHTSPDQEYVYLRKMMAVAEQARQSGRLFRVEGRLR
jgi:superfamily I DNA and/or RNA helicase